MKTLARVFLVLTLFSASAAFSQGCDQPRELRGTDTPYSLWGVCLRFSPISRETRLSLDSIVYLPVKEPLGRVTLFVDRTALTQQFIDDFFDHPRQDVIDRHQLGQRGIVVSLTPKRLKIAIHPSVILRLRTDMLGDSSYRTFVGQPTFMVEEVSGKAFAATDLNRIASAFPDLYFQYVVRMAETASRTLPDGRTQSVGTIRTEDALPPRQPPSKSAD